jgi:hypothetical protein
MGALTSPTAQYGHAAIAVEKRRQATDIGLCRHHNRRSG